MAQVFEPAGRYGRLGRKAGSCHFRGACRFRGIPQLWADPDPAICQEAARELELPQPELESYLRQNIDFSLGEENRRGLERYFHEAAKLGLISREKKIEWAICIKRNGPSFIEVGARYIVPLRLEFRRRIR